jgi:hypothetical protein
VGSPLTGTGTISLGFSAGYSLPTTSQQTGWDTAYSWGNHAAAGYLTSFTETDPVFSAAPASGIAAGDITNWNTAYGWGDHAAAGYLDDYEEGTWTPVLNSSNGDATFTYVHQHGHYTKVGRLVTVALWVQARATSIGTGAGALLENLPFAQSTSFSRRHGSAAFGSASGFVTTQPTGVSYTENRTTAMVFSGITPSNFNTVSDMSLYGQFFFYTA